MPEGDWRTWLLMAGRGYGKTRIGAETVRAEVESKRSGRIALVGATHADVRDVMLEGESGLVGISPPWMRPRLQYNRRRVVWPNGAVAFIYSAEEPERLRGPQHDFAWCDEVAAWRYPEAWDQLQFGLRIGNNPRAVATTTPKPSRIIKELVADPTTHVTTGTTYDNRANLAPAFFAKIIKRYEGTRLGRQELLAELLTDNPKALWKREWIEQHRVAKAPELNRVVVAIDPAVTSNIDSDETGIVVVGRKVDDCYPLADYSGVFTPDGWARRAVKAYHDHNADCIVAEVNNGGDMVEHVIRSVDKNVRYKSVHATRGKEIRAEPVSGLYEQGRVHHVGTFSYLEDQMCDFDPTEKSRRVSPDRMDSLVWGITELMGITTTGMIDFMASESEQHRQAQGKAWPRSNN